MKINSNEIYHKQELLQKIDELPSSFIECTMF